MNGLLGALTGAILACLYVASLWFTVGRVAGWPAAAAVFWLGLASLVRLALVGLWFLSLASLGWEAALAGFVGFTVVRTAVVARLGG